MKNFGMDLKRALDSHGIGASELANTAGVTGDAVARWLKCIPFQRIKNPLAKSDICDGFFACYRLATVVYAAKSIRSAAYTLLEHCCLHRLRLGRKTGQLALLFLDRLLDAAAGDIEIL